MNCKTCNRKLDQENDPLSENHGGDCAYCMLAAESLIGDWETVKLIAIDIACASHLIIKRER
jgi:hypothetical protein